MNTKEGAKLRTQNIDKIKVKITLAKLGFLPFTECKFRVIIVSAVSLPHQWQGRMGLVPHGYLKVLRSVMAKQFANRDIFIFTALQGEKGTFYCL